MPGNDTSWKAAGIDIGTSAIKLALIETDADGTPQVIATALERIRRREPGPIAEGLLDLTLRDYGWERGDLAYIATTGEGESLSSRTGHFYGMTTHARGGLFLEPEARAVLDIGALHTRAVLMDDRAKVLGYRMTSQCASGSGQFLENISRYLGVTVDEIGPLSRQSQNPENCSSICAVLAETDVINLVSRNIPIPDILKGIHLSMGGRYLKLLTSARVHGVVLVTGGLARDEGMMAAMIEEATTSNTTIELRSHPLSIHAGAIGAGIWGAYRARKLAQTSEMPLGAAA